MNKDQIKGAVKDAAGKVQREFGEAVDSPEHQVKGAAKQAEGKAQTLRREALINNMLDQAIDAFEKQNYDEAMDFCDQALHEDPRNDRAMEIRDAVVAFRQSGKRAIALSESFGELSPGTGGYYVATAFDATNQPARGRITIIQGVRTV